MKIALDVRIAQFLPYSYRGFGYVAKNLTKSLLEKHSGNHEFFIIGYNNFSNFSILNLEKYTILKPLSFIDSNIYFNFYRNFQFIESYLLKKTLEKNNVDILLTFSTGDSDFRIQKGNYKVIRVFFDMIPLIFEKQYLRSEKLKKKYLNYLQSFTDSNAILAISESAKNDLLSKIKFDRNKVFVAYPGVDVRFDKLEKSNIKKYGIEGKYILHLGGYDFRKNVKMILESYNKLDLDIKNNYKLILAGKIPTNDKIELDSIISKLNLKKNVIFAGFIDNKDLPNLYRNAALFVFPSLYEGFGLPVADAMRFGCPVVTSDNSSLKEIANIGAILVDPLDTDSIKNAMTKILSDSDLRNELIKKSHENVKRFTWDRAALKTIDIFANL
ncbi:MAG: glycosyltransferase family 1 protein [Patescibacteria group bacterium]|jgi:glycosyltransferase involved in cell wall biosynthesis